MARKKGRIAHQPIFHHVPFWSTVVLLLVLGGVTLFNLNSESSITGGVVVQTIGYMRAGEELFFEVKQGGIHDATFTFTNDVKNGKIFFEEDPLIYFKGTAFSKMAVRAENIEFNCMDITLKILENDLNQNGINPNEVALYVNGVKQETTLQEVGGGYNYYSISCVTELGQFVIGKEETVAQPVKVAEVAPEETTSEAVSEMPETTSVGELPQDAIVGEAASVPPEERPEVQQPAKLGFWQGVKEFFRSLFG